MPHLRSHRVDSKREKRSVCSAAGQLFKGSSGSAHLAKLLPGCCECVDPSILQVHVPEQAGAHGGGAAREQRDRCAQPAVCGAPPLVLAGSLRIRGCWGRVSPLPLCKHHLAPAWHTGGFSHAATSHPSRQQHESDERWALQGRADSVSTPFLQVRYRLPPFAWAREPLLWAASLAAVLGAFLIFLRSDFSLVRPGAANEARGRSQASAVAARAVAVFAGAFITLQTLKIMQCLCSGAANEARGRSQAGGLAARAVAVFAGAPRSQLGGCVTKSVSGRVVYCGAS